MAERVDPKGRSLDVFMDLVGCSRCEKKNNGYGTWPSKEAMYGCAGRKDDVRRAHESGTPIEVVDCEYKTTKPTQIEEPALV